ncbi:hypothetical protein M407DRAFT_240877 [Tulasnella calospora MUT 4182]|uniref:Uncharacterized protein n=1 Tax=Tulasnella calospora MUT 4182 TaxID=1051891 RepID=A0A0C3QW89_9AGAM|nr:hypothetical protein M407DRAFT_247078 [Tulasnella calospora MUT 4182]KIO34036.1 hypothetical protein M407DRAFT_240877 [Tulasnella calospora MUT 4182]
MKRAAESKGGRGGRNERKSAEKRTKGWERAQLSGNPDRLEAHLLVLQHKRES